MKIQEIQLRNFRSYPQRSFRFAPQGNLIIGSNGSGKTNLLEAIAYTSLGKSIRYHKDDELVHFGADFFALSADYQMDSQQALNVQLSWQDTRKNLKINGLLSRQLSALLGQVKVIYFAPEDNQLVNGSPRVRRQYFDLAISQLYPEYITELREYLHLVDQRNSLLKSNFEAAEKAAWDQKFCIAACEIYRYRRRYIEQINSVLASAYASISESFPQLELSYKGLHKGIEELPPEALKQLIDEALAREKIWQRTLIGPHLDDYSFRFKGSSLRVYASGGQKRIAVIVLKLAQATLVEEHSGICPIMLFDDIFAELDARHSQKISELCGTRFQSIIASPNPEIRSIFTDYPIIEPLEQE